MGGWKREIRYSCRLILTGYKTCQRNRICRKNALFNNEKRRRYGGWHNNLLRVKTFPLPFSRLPCVKGAVTKWLRDCPQGLPLKVSECVLPPCLPLKVPECVLPSQPSPLRGRWVCEANSDEVSTVKKIRRCVKKICRCRPLRKQFGKLFFGRIGATAPNIRCGQMWASVPTMMVRSTHF